MRQKKWILKQVNSTYLLCGLFICLCQSGQAQELNCAKQLERARDAYRAGKPEKVEAILRDCLVGGLSREEATEARKLLTVTYSLEDNAATDSAFHDLFSRNPEFKIDLTEATDPAELIYLYEEFHTDPRLWIRFEGGLNRSQPRLLQAYGTGLTSVNGRELYPEGPTTLYQYDPQLGYQAGVTLAVPIFSRNIRLNVGAKYASIRYQGDFTILTNLNDQILPVFDLGDSEAYNLEFTENQQLFQIPIFISLDMDRWSQYNFEKNAVVPFFYGGVTVMSLLQADFESISRTGGINIGANDRTEARNEQNIAFTMGGGLKVKVFGTHLLLDARYSYWLKNVVDPAERYSNDQLLYRFGYVDNDFTYSVFSVGVGYEVPFYRPTRRRNTLKR